MRCQVSPRDDKIAAGQAYPEAAQAQPQLAKASALISLRDMEVRSQESEARMAAVYAPRSLLTSSNAAERAWLSAYPRSLARIKK